MDPKIIAAFLGAFVALIGGQIMEHLRRRQERKSLASAFAGEINAILQMGEHVQPAVTMKEYVEKLRSGENTPLPLVIRDIKFEEVYKANVDKIGLLGGDIPERLASFYTYLFNLRGDLRAVEVGEYENRGLDATAFLVEQNLELWRKLESHAEQLVVDLRSIAGYSTTRAL